MKLGPILLTISTCPRRQLGEIHDASHRGRCGYELLLFSCHLNYFYTEHGFYYQKRKTRRIIMTEFFRELPRGQDSEPREAAPGHYHRTSQHLRVCPLVQLLEQLHIPCNDLSAEDLAFLLSFFIALSGKWMALLSETGSALAPLAVGLFTDSLLQEYISWN